jgi:GAF domain-containing protein
MARRTKAERYGAIRAQLAELFAKTRDPLARRATAAALLFAKLPGVSWAGFYMLRDGELVVDAYQGPVACLVLEKRRGVCWAGIDRRETVIVPDVHAFPGHIPCDDRSRSEIVVPLLDATGEPVGVLDLDSTSPARFDDEDAAGLVGIVGELGECV